MADTQAPAGKSANSKSSINWPVWLAAGLTLVFVIGVWVNNYRVSHAAAAAAAIAAKK
jgi:hypothetical protein